MKKLTKENIPKGYKYAIVDNDGKAWVTVNKPILKREHDYSGFVKAYWTNPFPPLRRLIGKDFDATDWQNSLIEADNEKVK